MAKYHHRKHGLVEAIAIYSDVIIVVVDGSEKAVSVNALTPVEESSSLPPSSVSPVVSAIPAELGMSSETVVRLNAVDTTIELLAESLPMIGRARANQILSNRPEQGYQNWDHLVQCNKDYISIDWDAFKLVLQENLIKLDYS